MSWRLRESGEARTTTTRRSDGDVLITACCEQLDRIEGVRGRSGGDSANRAREREARAREQTAARGGREESTGLPRAGDAQQRSRVCAVRRSVVGESGGGGSEGCVGAERGGELMRVGRVSCQRSLAPLRPVVEARRKTTVDQGQAEEERR